MKLNVLILSVFIAFGFIACEMDSIKTYDDPNKPDDVVYDNAYGYNTGDVKGENIMKFADIALKIEQNGSINNSTKTTNKYDYLADNSGIESFLCYATEVIEYNPGLNSAGSDLAENRKNTTNALGEPQDNDTINFVSLGMGGKIILKFDDPIANGMGQDLRIIETSYGTEFCSDYPEKAIVYGSKFGENWVQLKTICQDDNIDLDLGNLEWVQYIKIVDVTNPEDFNVVIDGYDLDGVVASCVDVDNSDDNEDDTTTGDTDTGTDTDSNTCENGWLSASGEEGTGCECSDQLDSLSMDISIDYLHPNAPGTNGEIAYYIGTDMEYNVIINNTGTTALENLQVTALFEYSEFGTLCAGEPIRVWEGVTIQANQRAILHDNYYLSFENIPTYFKTHIIVKQFTDTCTTGYAVYDNPKEGEIHDPFPEN